jgi:protein-disulfide isomerase
MWYDSSMQVALFGRVLRIRLRYVLLSAVVALFAGMMVLFGYYFVRSFLAIRSGGAEAWYRQTLESSVSRAVANTEITEQDLRALTRDGRPSLGPVDAPLTVVAFLDYQCPFCQRSAAALREAMVKYQHRVRFIIRDFPIEEIHPEAFQSALGARCAFAQDNAKGWAMHDALYLNQSQQSPADVERYAAQAGIDMTKYRTCVEGQIFAGSIREDLADGLRAGVQGTPTYFFNGIRIQGVPTDRQAEYFDFLIQQFLEEAQADTAPATP